MASPKFSALMKARRQFDVVNFPPDEFAAMVSKRFPETSNVKGFYSPAGSRPMVALSGNDRAFRRHEVMHGIRDMATSYGEGMESAIPLWARAGQRGGFADELLARLASGDRSQLSGWPTERYPRYSMSDRALYAAFDTARDAGRYYSENPAILGASVVGGSVLGYGAFAPEERKESPRPNSLDAIIERLGR